MEYNGLKAITGKRKTSPDVETWSL